jgi:hypothetical protein
MDWRAVDRMAENLFRVEFERIRKQLAGKYRGMHPSKFNELVRKLAKREVDRWLEVNYGVDWDGVKAKIIAEDVSLDDLAV